MFAPRLLGVMIAALTDFYTCRLSSKILGHGSSAGAVSLFKLPSRCPLDLFSSSSPSHPYSTPISFLDHSRLPRKPFSPLWRSLTSPYLDRQIRERFSSAMKV